MRWRHIYMKRVLMLAAVAAPLLLTACAAEANVPCGSTGASASLTCDPVAESSEETTGTTDDDLWGRAFAAESVSGTADAENLMNGVDFVLRFEKGSLSAYAACNQIGAGLELTDGKLVTDVVTATQMACEEPAMSHDEWIIDLLDAQPDYSLDGGVLTLTSGAITVELAETDPADQE